METLKINVKNIANYGHELHEQKGTISIDFANYLDKLQNLQNINLQDLIDKGWHQIGFRFTDSLIFNSEKLHLDIVLSRKKNQKESEFAFVKREIAKSDFLSLIVNVRVNLSSYNHFFKNDINWKELKPLD